MANNGKKTSKGTHAVLFVAPGIAEVPSTRGGGIEQNIFALANRMPIRSTIFSPRYYPNKNGRISSLVDYSLVRATRVYPPNPHLGLSDLPEIIRLLLYYLTVAIYILRHGRRFHTVVLFDYFFGTIPLFLARILGKKCAYMEYNITPWICDSTSRYTVANKLQLIFGKLVASKCSLVTANSPSILKGIVGAGILANKLMLIPTILDQVEGLKHYSEDSSATRLPNQVAYIGRLVEERGAEMLPAIISEVLERKSDVSFVIAGDGPLRSRIEDLIMDKKCARNVRLMGQLPRESVFKVIASSSVVIFISHKENFGSLALEECIQMRRPIIATNVGSTRLRIMHGINGLLADPTPKSIAETVIEFLTNDILRLKIVSNLNRNGIPPDGKKIAATLSRALLLGKTIGGVYSE